jgi:hypothetical protein
MGALDFAGGIVIHTSAGVGKKFFHHIFSYKNFYRSFSSFNYAWKKTWI